MCWGSNGAAAFTFFTSITCFTTSTHKYYYTCYICVLILLCMLCMCPQVCLLRKQQRCCNRLCRYVCCVCCVCVGYAGMYCNRLCRCVCWGSSSAAAIDYAGNLFMCPQTTIYAVYMLYMCPQSVMPILTLYVSSDYYICCICVLRCVCFVSSTHTWGQELHMLRQQLSQQRS